MRLTQEQIETIHEQFEKIATPVDREISAILQGADVPVTRKHLEHMVDRMTGVLAAYVQMRKAHHDAEHLIEHQDAVLVGLLRRLGGKQTFTRDELEKIGWHTPGDGSYVHREWDAAGKNATFEVRARVKDPGGEWLN